jgi:class 3 adenylate cyclase
MNPAGRPRRFDIAAILLHALRAQVRTMRLLLDRFALFYPMRIVGTTFMVIVATLYALHLDRFGAFYYGLVLVLVVYPHVVHAVARKYPQNRRAIELRTFLLDSFVVGVVVHSIGFGPFPTFVLITVALASALSVDGPRQSFLSAAAVTAGVVAYAVFFPVNTAFVDTVPVDIVSSAFTFIYFMAFAYSARNRSALLLRSEAELRERTASLEIEKLRSDRLLLNLLPSGLAAHMAMPGGIQPARFERVVLLGIEMRHFSRLLQSAPDDEALAHLMHCFKAFDAIADRFGMEKLKTMGDVYIAIAGLPVSAPDDAASGIRAAWSVREFLNDLAEARRAHGASALDARIAVHAGSVIGGVVETSKLSYDVFGDAIRTLFGLLHRCEDGAIVVSDAARHLAGAGFERPGIDAAGSAAASVSHADGIRSQAPSGVAAQA